MGHRSICIGSDPVAKRCDALVMGYRARFAFAVALISASYACPVAATTFEDPNPPSPPSSSSTHATGGSVTTGACPSGDCTFHTFTSDGSFHVTDTALTSVDVLVVGGGGAGSPNGGGGGGGEVVVVQDVSVGIITVVTVGDGGGPLDHGSDSAFGDIKAKGGLWNENDDGAGGSSGGSSGNLGGGKGSCGWCNCDGGGGGGAGNPGDTGNNGLGADGGDGIISDMSGSDKYYGGGGAGFGITGLSGDGGQGGGGDDGRISGRANTGGGGGGGCIAEGNSPGTGGSGVVIVRYTTPAESAALVAPSEAPNDASPPSSDIEQDDTLEMKEKAERTRDAMLTGVTNAKLKKKAKLLADAAISGKKVRKMSAKLTAPDEDTACSDYYTKAGISSSLGACIATAAFRHRSLAAMAYDIFVFFNEAEVDDATLTAAENLLKAEGVMGVETSDPIDPITELGTIDGVDSSILETFKMEASAAAALVSPSPPPLPPSPSSSRTLPPPNLIRDEDDHAPTTLNIFLLLATTALNFLL